MSQNDHRALQILEANFELTDCNNQIVLPWKSYSPMLENNKEEDEVRLILLKKRLHTNLTVYQEYSMFMKDLLQNKYVRKVSRTELNKEKIKKNVFTP